VIGRTPSALAPTPSRSYRSGVMTMAKARICMVILATLLGCGNEGSSGDGAADAGTDAVGTSCVPAAAVREEITPESTLYPKIAHDAAGGIHVAYELFDTPSNPLEYAYRDPATGTWHRETVTDMGSAGLDLAVEPSGRVHLVKSAGVDLLYAFRDPGGAWEFDSVSMPSFLPAMAVDKQGEVYVCGHESGGALGCAHRALDGTWEADLVPIAATVIGYMAMAIGPDGVPHLLFSGRDIGVSMRIGHAWRPASAGPWESEWVTDPSDSFADGISVVIDAAGTIHAAFADRINSDVTPRSFTRWRTTLRYVRRGVTDTHWSVEALVNDVEDPSLALATDDSVVGVFAPVLPYGAAHGLIFATLDADGTWKQEPFSCGVVRTDLLRAVTDGCCVHVVFDNQGDAAPTLEYARYCPEDVPTLDLGVGRCLTDVCQAEVAACENAWCPGDSDPVSSCERAAMFSYPSCTSYDLTANCASDDFSCPEVTDEWVDLQTCIRERCYSPCQ
jgi:hypothetical protein